MSRKADSDEVMVGSYAGMSTPATVTGALTVETAPLHVEPGAGHFV